MKCSNRSSIIRERTSFLGIPVTKSPGLSLAEKFWLFSETADDRVLQQADFYGLLLLSVADIYMDRCPLVPKDLEFRWVLALDTRAFGDWCRRTRVSAANRGRLARSRRWVRSSECRKLHEWIDHRLKAR